MSLPSITGIADECEKKPVAKCTAEQRAEDALGNSRMFCDLLAQARQYKAPGWWDGSAFRSHPCGLIAGTIKLTNFWHVDNMCAVEITDGAGWNAQGVCQDSFAHGDPHPRPIEGSSMRAWWCGQWVDAAYEEALRPRLLEILTAAARHIEAAQDEERGKKRQADAAREQALQDIKRAAIAKATGSAQ